MSRRIYYYSSDEEFYQKLRDSYRNEKICSGSESSEEDTSNLCEEKPNVSNSKSHLERKYVNVYPPLSSGTETCSSPQLHPSIPSTSTGTTSTATIKNPGPNARDVDDEDLRSNKRQKLRDSNSNEKISNEQAIVKLVNKYDIRKKVNFMITKNALKAVREKLGWNHFGCYADSLVSIIEDALENVEEQIEEVKQIVSYVKNSTSCCKILEEYQIQHGQSPKPLIQALDTSWNSTFLMLKRFIELEDAVKSTLNSVNPVAQDSLKIKEENWTLYKELCRILSPFEVITTRLMSDENFGTGSCIITMTRCLTEECQRLLAKTGLSENSRKTAQLLKSGLKERFENIEKNATLSVNTFLDPRFKTHGFSNQVKAIRTKEKIRKMIVEMIAKAEPITPPDNDEDDPSPWKTFDREVSTNTCHAMSMRKALEEVDKFLSDEMLPREDASGNSTCPHKWWKEREYLYPNLKKIYETKCNIVATSVSCERIISRLRLNSDRLTSSELEQIMFLDENSRFAGF